MNALVSNHPSNGRQRVLIVDDHPIVRRGLAELLAHEPHIEVCGAADNVADAIKEVEARGPHLVIVDMSLNESSGLELIAELKTRWPDIKTLAWSMFDEKIFAERALRAGAMGYVNKKEPIENMVGAVRQVLQGNVYLSPQMTNRLLHRAMRRNTGRRRPDSKIVEPGTRGLSDARQRDDHETDRPDARAESQDDRGPSREHQDEAGSQERLRTQSLCRPMDVGKRVEDTLPDLGPGHGSLGSAGASPSQDRESLFTGSRRRRPLIQTPAATARSAGSAPQRAVRFRSPIGPPGFPAAPEC